MFIFESFNENSKFILYKCHNDVLAPDSLVFEHVNSPILINLTNIITYLNIKFLESIFKSGVISNYQYLFLISILKYNSYSKYYKN